jgi:hypothetical protein
VEAVARSSGNGKKVAVCHKPPGNADHEQSIAVSEEAVSSHLAHGDYLGECVGGCSAASCDDGDLCTYCWIGYQCIPNGALC